MKRSACATFKQIEDVNSRVSRAIMKATYIGIKEVTLHRKE